MKYFTLVVSDLPVSEAVFHGIPTTEQRNRALYTTYVVDDLEFERTESPQGLFRFVGETLMRAAYRALFRKDSNAKA